METYKYFVNEHIALFRVLSHPWKTKALKANSHAKWLANLVYILLLQEEHIHAFCLFIYLACDDGTINQETTMLVWRHMTTESLGL